MYPDLDLSRIFEAVIYSISAGHNFEVGIESELGAFEF